MDKKIEPVIVTLNNLGYLTKASCQGGGSGKWGVKGHDKEGYIAFEDKLDKAWEKIPENRPEEEQEFLDMIRPTIQEIFKDAG